MSGYSERSLAALNQARVHLVWRPTLDTERRKTVPDAPCLQWLVFTHAGVQCAVEMDEVGIFAGDRRASKLWAYYRGVSWEVHNGVNYFRGNDNSGRRPGVWSIEPVRLEETFAATVREAMRAAMYHAERIRPGSGDAGGI